MQKTIDKVVIIVFGYLRMINISEVGSFYRTLEDFEESIGGVWVIGKGIDFEELQTIIPFGEWIFTNEELPIWTSVDRSRRMHCFLVVCWCKVVLLNMCCLH